MVENVTVDGRITPDVVRLTWTECGETYHAYIDQTSYVPYLRLVERQCDRAPLPHCSHGFGEAVEVAKRIGSIAAFRATEYERHRKLRADRAARNCDHIIERLTYLCGLQSVGDEAAQELRAIISLMVSPS